MPPEVRKILLGGRRGSSPISSHTRRRWKLKLQSADVILWPGFSLPHKLWPSINGIGAPTATVNTWCIGGPFKSRLGVNAVRCRPDHRTCGQGMSAPLIPHTDGWHPHGDSGGPGLVRRPTHCLLTRHHLKKKKWPCFCYHTFPKDRFIYLICIVF